MAFNFVRGAGDSLESPAALLMYASGIVRAGGVVEFSKTGGVGVTPSSASSTTTTVFGICLDYAQGASDTQVRVVPIVAGQLWQADCTDVALTAQIGLRHILNADQVTVRNTSTDVTGATGVFRAVAMTGLSTGSGKLIGYFETIPKMAANTSTFN
jgi:hypothetical protein